MSASFDDIRSLLPAAYVNASQLMTREEFKTWLGEELGKPSRAALEGVVLELLRCILFRETKASPLCQHFLHLAVTGYLIVRNEKEKEK